MIYVFILGITNNKYNKLGCYSVQLDSSWEDEWWEGVGVESMNSLFESSLSCVPSFNFLLCLQLVKKFVVVWCGGCGGGVVVVA